MKASNSRGWDPKSTVDFGPDGGGEDSRNTEPRDPGGEEGTNTGFSGDGGQRSHLRPASSVVNHCEEMSETIA